MIEVAEALARIIAGHAPTGVERVGLARAAGRVLAEPIVAARPQPPADVSAMDGYAVRARDVSAAPVRLRIVDRIQAGALPSREIGPGEAAQLFTGAMVPAGADAIVIVENADRDGDSLDVREGSPPGKHIRRAGGDFPAGATLLSPPRRLTPEDVSLIAAANRPDAAVRLRPRVAILATGDELRPPGSDLGPAQIVAASTYGVTAMIEAAGGEALDLGLVADDLDATRAALRRARDADILVTLGGASVGEADLVKGALAAEGVALDFWKIAMRPGKPLMYGRRGRQPVLGLPGNPVSALVCARLFLLPLVEALLGLPARGHATIRAHLGAAMPANDRRQDYVRARIARTAAGLIATPFPVQDSSMLGALAASQGLIVRAPDAPDAPEGAEVDILPLPALEFRPQAIDAPHE